MILSYFVAVTGSTLLPIQLLSFNKALDSSSPDWWRPSSRLPATTPGQHHSTATGGRITGRVAGYSNGSGS